MKMLARAALWLSASLVCALASAPPANATGTPASCPRADGAYIACTPVVLVDPTTGLPIGTAGLPTADPNNASFTFAPAGGASESSTATSYTFSTANQSLARGWYANCPTNTAIVVTLIGVNGGSAPRTLYDGWQDSADRLAGFSGNSTGCTIGERF